MAEQNQQKVDTKPFLYKEVMALNTELHARLKLKTEPNFEFARQTNAIPLALSEFVPASVHYPIVFATEGAVVPSVVVGIRNSENIFVDAQGKWVAGAYLPAYVRRYPFILASGKQADFSDAVLYMDPSYAGFNPREGEFLVTDGKPSDLTRKAVDFCLAYAREGKETEAFCTALQTHDLLIKRQMVISGELAKQLSNGGENYTLGDFSVIDDQKLRSLPDETVLEWFKRGWLQAAYAQIASTMRWDAVISRMNAQTSIAAPQKPADSPAV